MNRTTIGTRVILREQSPEDAAFFAYWFNQPQVMFQCGFTEPTDEVHERFTIENSRLSFPIPKSSTRAMERKRSA